MSRRLVVDPTACDAFGYCAEILPELIGLDEWGFPVLAGGPVDPRLVDAARRAVASCPRRALRLEKLPLPPPIRRQAPTPANRPEPRPAREPGLGQPRRGAPGERIRALRSQ